MTKSIVLKLLENREWDCAICGVSLVNEVEQLKEYYNQQYDGAKMRKKTKRTSINIDIDHIYPKSKGGVNELFNFQLTHRECNKKKSDKVIPN